MEETPLGCKCVFSLSRLGGGAAFNLISAHQKLLSELDIPPPLSLRFLSNFIFIG